MFPSGGLEPNEEGWHKDVWSTMEVVVLPPLFAKDSRLSESAIRPIFGFVITSSVMDW
jgi:hypothetical protein